MNYFTHQMNVGEIGLILIKLHKIELMMAELSNREYLCIFYIERKHYPFDYSGKTKAYLKIVPKIKARLERMFQKELAKLVDFHYIAKEFPRDLLYEISEIDPDSVCEEAIRIETRRK